MLEKRRFVRKQVNGYLEIYSRTTDELIGRVINMSIMGAMLISKGPIEVPRSFSSKMDLPDEILGRSQIIFDVESLWSKKNDTLGCYETGYQIISISRTDMKILKRLLQSQIGEESDILGPKTFSQKTKV